MSTSLKDHVKVFQAKYKRNCAKDDYLDRKEEVLEWEFVLREKEREIRRLKLAMDRSKILLEKSETKLGVTQEELENFESIAASNKPSTSSIIVDPLTGLPEGEKITVTEEDTDYIEKVSMMWTIQRFYLTMKSFAELSSEEIKDNASRVKELSSDDIRSVLMKHSSHLQQHKTSKTNDEAGNIQRDAVNNLEMISKMTSTQRTKFLQEKWEEVRQAEDQVTKILNSDSFQNYVNRRLLGVVIGAVQATCADFVKPYSLPTKDTIKKTFNYAKSHPEETAKREEEELNSSINPRRSKNQEMPNSSRRPVSPYPDGVCQTIMSMIQENRSIMEGEVRQQMRQQEHLVDGEEESQKHSQHQDLNQLILDKLGEAQEEDDDKPNAVRQAIFDTVENQIKHNFQRSAAELTLPTEISAPIARYNSTSHFAFQSDAACASVDTLDQALMRCQLRSRLKGTEEGTTRTRAPFEFTLNSSVDCLDLDGDTFAICGDLRRTSNLTDPSFQTSFLKEFSASSSDVQFFPVVHGNPLNFDSKVKYSPSSACIADAENERIWTSSVNGQIFGYTTRVVAEQREAQDRNLIGMLAFEDAEIRSQAKYSNSSFGITRCGQNLVGSAATNRLSIWDTQKAADDFPLSSSLPKNEDSCDNEEELKPKKKIRLSRPMMCDNSSGDSKYKGLPPHIIKIEDNDTSFLCGDLQALNNGTQLAVAPASIVHSSYDTLSNSIRLVDLNTERVTGLLCGSQGRVSIEKQYLTEENLLFSSDEGTAFVWDLRTMTPTILLHQNYDRQSVRVLGVPGSNGRAAFTFGPCMECIQAWDLRMPVCQTYTMATGNAKITDLFWHGRTSSLFAMAQTNHFAAHRRYTRNMDGKGLSWVKENEVDCFNSWPPSAQHERGYFGPIHWNLRDPTILQYSFENGSPICTSYQ